ncbi:MAG: choice-of-anchor D domain-containing protein [Gemmatimonadota bacterium]
MTDHTWRLRMRRTAIALAGALPFVMAGPTAAWAQQATVSGQLASIWEDPLPELGTPRLRHFLSRGNGEMVPLRVSESQLRAVGGVEGSTGLYVEVTGSWQGPRRTPGASADSELEVSSIRYSVAPAGAFAEPQGAPIFGSQPWVTVLCRFSDYPTTEPHSLTWYQDLLGAAEPQLDHYWREVSFDQANVAGSVAHGWYDLPHEKAYYVNDTTRVANLQLLKEDCAAVADADVYFPNYVGINFQFNENLAGFSWGGGSSLTIDGVSRFYRVTWMSNWADQFVYGHEMGHGFGLPHSSGPYGAVYDSRWDVMSGARNFNNPTYGWIGPHTISFHKETLGWIPADRIYDATFGTSATITLHRLGDMSAPGDFMMARIPLADGTYYTVESRRSAGYDAYLPAETVVLHHIDGRAFVVDPDGDGDPNDDGAQWMPGETFTDAENGIAVTVDAQVAEGHLVTIALMEPGHIELDPSSIAFSAQQGTDPAPQSFTLGNTGTGDLDWTASDDAAWLELGQTSGSVASGGSLDITATVAATELVAGTYNALVTVSGSAENSPQTLAVSLEVTPAPVLTLVAEPIDLEVVIGVDPPVHEVVVRNEGGNELTWSASSDVEWMTFTRGSGTLAPGASETDSITISVDGLALGDYAGTLTFTGNAPNSPQTLDAMLSVVESPSIALAGTFEFEAYEGDSPAPETLTVSNDGGGTLSWSVSADEAWVNLSATAGTLVSGGSTTLQVTANGSSLAAGTHTAVITVSGNADDSPQTADVVFVIVARPDMAPQDVADHLMGVSTTLSASELEYLDDIGNQNGGFDVGDFRAWLQMEGLMSRVAPAAGEEVAP